MTYNMSWNNMYTDTAIKWTPSDGVNVARRHHKKNVMLATINWCQDTFLIDRQLRVPMLSPVHDSINTTSWC